MLLIYVVFRHKRGMMSNCLVENQNVFVHKCLYSYDESKYNVFMMHELLSIHTSLLYSRPVYFYSYHLSVFLSAENGISFVSRECSKTNQVDDTRNTNSPTNRCKTYVLVIWGKACIHGWTVSLIPGRNTSCML